MTKNVSCFVFLKISKENICIEKKACFWFSANFFKKKCCLNSKNVELLHMCNASKWLSEQVKEVGRLKWLISSSPKFTFPLSHPKKRWIIFNTSTFKFPDLEFCHHSPKVRRFWTSDILTALSLAAQSIRPSLLWGEIWEQITGRKKGGEAPTSLAAGCDSCTWTIKWQHPRERNRCHLL